ncbi:hypothetical protein FACS1894103_5800 [Campylobacterota bacterium]|nr:hypothetical protein FACS1894103_5800 [Campylobacterota bacterium]
MRNLHGEMAFNSFVPAPLPPDPPLLIDSEMLTLIVSANRELAALESLSSNIPDVDIFVSMYVLKEALMSSQIEGTQATLEDMFDPSIATNANLDTADVVNYISAMEFALKRLRELPLSARLIREIHAVLMQGVRGNEKSAGEFRTTQNWIGAGGSTIKTARYIPPSPHEMSVAMSDLERYMHAPSDLDTLIRAALIHYQFETIHPFLDGNGRIGRLLIVLFLMAEGVLSAPVLYISFFLKKSRTEYYDRLSEVRASGNYEQWVKFFLRAVYECADDAVIKIGELTKLREKNRALITDGGRSKSALRLFGYLQKHPIIEIQQSAKELDMAFNTVASAAKRLIGLGILEPTKDGKRNRVFAYTAYIEALKNRA